MAPNYSRRLRQISAAFLVATIFAARAETIVSTTFSSGDDLVNLVGTSSDQPATAPDGANLANGLFLLTGGGAYDVWMKQNAARMHNGGAVAITLGEHNASAKLTISAQVCFPPPPEADASGNEAKIPEEDIKSGVAILGFYSQVTPQAFGFLYKNFTGLQVKYDGSLQLYVNGDASGSAQPFGGKYDPLSPTPLSYTVDTAMGAITNVTFGASTTKYDFATTAFTKEATGFAGFGGSMGNHPLNVEFREFSVSGEASATAHP